MTQADPVAYLRDDNGGNGDLEITGPEDRAGFPVFTAPPADERDARIAELKIELNKAIQQSLPRRNETDSLRNQLAAAQAAIAGAIKWDAARKYIMPYKVRDPLHEAIATDQSAAGSEAV